MESKTAVWPDIADQPLTLVRANRFIILDVRTIQEFVGDHLRNAVHIPYDEIQVNIQKIRDWGKPVITYSDDGRRSKIAAATLSMMGIKAIDGGSLTKVKSLFGQEF